MSSSIDSDKLIPPMIVLMIIICVALFALGTMYGDSVREKIFQDDIVSGNITNKYVIVSKTNVVELSHYTYTLKWGAVRQTDSNVLFQKP